MREHQLAAMKIIAADPNIDSILSSLGGGGPVGGNNGRLFMRLKDRSERKLNANQIIQELRPKFAQMPGLNIFCRSPRSSASAEWRARRFTNTACRTAT